MTDGIKNTVNARFAAFFSFKRYDSEQKFADIELSNTMKRYSVPDNEKALYARLFYGTIEKRITLDYLISKAAGRSISDIGNDVLIILRIGAYQLFFMKKIPKHAACDEAAKMCHMLLSGNRAVAGFCNAVMRRMACMDMKSELPDVSDLSSPRELSIYFSVPREIIALWCSQYGKVRTFSVLLGLVAEEKHASLRVNTLKTNKEMLQKLLERDGVTCGKPIIDDSLDAFEISGGLRVGTSGLFESGMFYVQSEPSQIAARALNICPGQTLIDMCASPGGKSFFSAIEMRNTGRVIGCDIHVDKLRFIKDGAKRLGIDIIETYERDACIYDKTFCGLADRVLCDVPCSGLGTLSKKPDVRYKDMSKTEKLPDIQRRILDNGAKYLKKNGILVYSTCTLNKKENEDIVSDFLREHKNFSPVAVNVSPTPAVHFGEGGCVTFFPDAGTHNEDGFFAACFKRED